MEFFIFPGIAAAQNNLPVFDAILAVEIRNSFIDELAYRPDTDILPNSGLLTIETVGQFHRRPKATGYCPLLRHTLITHADLAQAPVLGVGVRTAVAKGL